MRLIVRPRQATVAPLHGTRLAAYCASRSSRRTIPTTKPQWWARERSREVGSGATRLSEIGGFISGTVLILFGAGALYVGINGYQTVGDELTKEAIVGGSDMAPAEIQKAASEAGLPDTVGEARDGSSESAQDHGWQGHRRGDGQGVTVPGRPLDARERARKRGPSLRHGLRRPVFIGLALNPPFRFAGNSGGGGNRTRVRRPRDCRRQARARSRRGP
jgi:hypothetical protein